jgi:cytochrome c-type biogenesis protein CcmH
MIIWISAGAMLLLAAGFISYRLWFPEKIDPAAEQSGEQMNKVLYRQYLADLERQYPSGNEAAKQALLIEAQRQLLADEQAIGESSRRELAPEKRGGALLLTASLALMLLALVLYAHLGAMADVQIRNLLENQDDANTAELRDALTNRLEQQDDNFYYWLLLARIEMSSGRTAQSVQAYQRARQLEPGNGSVAAELAQALFGQAGNRINDEVESLIIDALENEPNNTIALELAGIVAFSRQDYSSAVTYWQRALRFIRADSANAKALQAGIAKATSLLNDKALLNAKAPASDGAYAQVAGAVLLSLDLKLDKSLSESGPVNPDSTVYVYVRQWQGPPMPLVAQRFTVNDLPLSVDFSDAMSLSPARKLSSVEQLEIIARVSLAGSLQASSGDLEGRLGPISLADTPSSPTLPSSYELIIDQRLP